MMGDFDGGGRRWTRITATVLAVVAVGLSAGAAGVWIGRGGTPAAVAASELTAGVSGVPMPPSWPATTPAPTPGPAPSAHPGIPPLSDMTPELRDSLEQLLGLTGQVQACSDAMVGLAMLMDGLRHSSRRRLAAGDPRFSPRAGPQTGSGHDRSLEETKFPRKQLLFHGHRADAAKP